MAANNQYGWPWAPPESEPERVDKSCRYTLELSFASNGVEHGAQNDEAAPETLATRGPRHAHRTIDNHVVKVCLDDGLPIPERIFRRLLRENAAPANQTAFKWFEPYRGSEVNHPVLRAIDVANWAKPPRHAVRLLNAPDELPQTKLSAQQREILETLDASDFGEMARSRFRGLYKSRQALADGIDELVERGLVEKFEYLGKHFLRRTAMGWGVKP